MPSHTKLTCPKCNSVIPGDSVFCQVCGSKLSDSTVPKPMYSDARLRHMLSNVDKWELMDWRRVQDRSALQMTEQQRQEALEQRLQQAQDIAIAKRITRTIESNSKTAETSLVILGIVAVIIAILTVTLLFRAVHNEEPRNFVPLKQSTVLQQVQCDCQAALLSQKEWMTHRDVFVPDVKEWTVQSL